MKVAITDVRQTLLSIILNKSKLSKPEADILASDYLEGELQGKLSHGLAAFSAMAEKLSGATTDFKIIKETDAFIYADATSALGAIVGRKLADIAITKAQTQGICVVAIKDVKTWLRPASTAEYIATKNMVGWVMNNGGPGTPMVIPPGGRNPVISTNPIGIGIPLDKQPLVMDMATSRTRLG